MILVDTSIWIDHLRSKDSELVELLEREEVLTHIFVVGEIALGNLKERKLVLANLQNLPFAVRAEDEEVMAHIEAASLFGLGIGYVDAHLLASVRLTSGSRLWTRDRPLSEAAASMGILKV